LFFRSALGPPGGQDCHSVHGVDDPLVVNDRVSLAGEKYTVSGIDRYSLSNLLGAVREWRSYTLRSSSGKTWLCLGFDEHPAIRWIEIDRATFTSAADAAVLNPELTGVAVVTFDGDRGHSTPMAEILVMSQTGAPYEFVACERFLEVDGIRSLRGNRHTWLESLANCRCLK
jgi:hypothetical protein